MALDRFITLVQTRALVPAAVLEEARRSLVEGGEEGSAFRLAALLVERGAIGESTAQELVAASAAPAQGGASPEGRLEGRTVGNWRVVRKISEGGMGAVYLAEHTSLERRAALKVVLDEHGGDTDALARFEQEARVLAKVRHPNIVDVIDFGRDGDRRYILMEFVDGESLEQALARRGPIPWREAAAWARDAARGLAAIHAAGLVHRDIKPSNILVDASGRVKIVDFGVVRELDRSLGLTMSGIAIGTPLYMPPEQARGRKVDARSDLYSLGATLFHLVAGEPPFNAESAVGVLMKHIGERPPRAPLDRRGCPAPLAMLILRTLAKEPRARVETAAELAEALEAILAGPEKRAGAAGAGEKAAARPATSAPRRAPAAPGGLPSGAVALGVALVLGLAALKAWRSDDDGARRPSAPGAGSAASASVSVRREVPRAAPPPSRPAPPQPAPPPQAKLTPDELLGSARRDGASPRPPAGGGSIPPPPPSSDPPGPEVPPLPRPPSPPAPAPEPPPPAAEALFAALDAEAAATVTARAEIARVEEAARALGPDAPFAPAPGSEEALAALAALRPALSAEEAIARLDWAVLRRRAVAEAVTRLADILRTAGELREIPLGGRGRTSGRFRAVTAKELVFTDWSGGEVAVPLAKLTLEDVMLLRDGALGEARSVERAPRDASGPDTRATTAGVMLLAEEGAERRALERARLVRDPERRAALQRLVERRSLLAARGALREGRLAEEWATFSEEQAAEAWAARNSTPSLDALRSEEVRRERAALRASVPRRIAWRLERLPERQARAERAVLGDLLAEIVEKDRPLAIADAEAVERALDRLFVLAPPGEWREVVPLGDPAPGRFWTALPPPHSSSEKGKAEWRGIDVAPATLALADGVRAELRSESKEGGLVFDYRGGDLLGVALWVSSRTVGWCRYSSAGELIDEAKQARRPDDAPEVGFTIEGGKLSIQYKEYAFPPIAWAPKRIRGLGLYAASGEVRLGRLMLRRAP